MNLQLPLLCYRTTCRAMVPVILGLTLLAGCGGGGGGGAASTGTSAGGSGSAGSGGTGSGGTGTGGTGTGGTGGGSTGPTVIAITGNDALRLADQAAFGPTPALVAAISAQGSAWIDAQIATPATGYAAIAAINSNPTVVCPTGDPDPYCYQNNYTALPVQIQFFHNALYGADQLRQRVALAYSQIFVISSVQIGPTYGIRNYQQMLLDDAFVNFRQLLNDVTLSPVMGNYLNMANNNKGNPAAGISPNENYAREVMQLFSVGPNMLNSDGSIVVDGNGNPVPTYTQDTIEGFASAFTGWTYPNAAGVASLASDNYTEWLTGQMIPVSAQHDSGTKLLLGETLPAGQNAAVDLKAALDDIFNHPNVAPFISQQMIKFLVTSNPSAAYVSRISAVFNDDGTGVRGNMAAVVKAILLDPEARGQSATTANFGKLREPVVDIVAILRALNATSDGVAPVAVAASMGEPLFGPDTVFSYYSPTYPLPGSTTLVGPQFGILNTATALARMNFINHLLYSTAPYPPATNVANSTGTTIDLSAYQANAGNVSTLIQQFNANLLHGTMSSTEVNAVTSALNAISSTDTTLAKDRTLAAAYLVLNSPRYQITR